MFSNVQPNHVDIDVQVVVHTAVGPRDLSLGISETKWWQWMNMIFSFSGGWFMHQGCQNPGVSRLCFANWYSPFVTLKSFSGSFQVELLYLFHVGTCIGARKFWLPVVIQSWLQTCLVMSPRLCQWTWLHDDQSLSENCGKDMEQLETIKYYSI